MPQPLTDTQKRVLALISELGGSATIKQIDAKRGYDSKGINHPLGILRKRGLLERLVGQDGEVRWQIIADQHPLP